MKNKGLIITGLIILLLAVVLVWLWYRATYSDKLTVATANFKDKIVTVKSRIGKTTIDFTKLPLPGQDNEIARSKNYQLGARVLNEDKAQVYLVHDQPTDNTELEELTITFSTGLVTYNALLLKKGAAKAAQQINRKAIINFPDANLTILR